MLMTLLLSIKLPRHMDDEDRYSEEAKFVYYLLLFTHFAILIVKLLRSKLAYKHALMYKSFLMLCLFLQLFSMNFVLGNWVYDNRDADLLTSIRGNDWHSNEVWRSFKMWMIVE